MPFRLVFSQYRGGSIRAVYPSGTKQTRAWQTSYSKPEASQTLSAGDSNNATDDFQGWYRLDVLSPEPTGSITAPYRVMCGADQADEPATTLKTTPAERKPATRQMQIQTLEQAPARQSKNPE